MALLPNLPSTIHTRSGLFVDPLDLRVEDIRIEDIAHHLGNQCRFSGAVSEFYSVAQHCVYASMIVEYGFEYDALLHDAAEAYLQDMARPLKNDPRFGQPYRGAEKRAEAVIGEALGVRFPMPPEVKVADERMLVTEARDLMHGTKDWKHFSDVKPLDGEIIPWSPKRARREFMDRYRRLKP